MKTSYVHNARFTFTHASPVVLGLAVYLFSLRPQVEARQESVRSLPPLSHAVQTQLGNVVVIASTEPARFSFQPGDGRTRHAAEGAEEAATAMLDLGADRALFPGPLLSIVPTVLAPFSAAAGAVSARRQVVDWNQLRTAETDLTTGAAPLCAQAGVQELLARTARERTHRPWPTAFTQAALTPGNPEWTRLSRAGFDSAVQLELQELRLERTGSSDTSYVLSMNGRLKLFRTRDGAVLYDELVEYRSGRGLFLDWSLNGAEPLRAVAAHGCQRIVDEIVKDVLLPDKAPNRKARGGSGKPASGVLEVSAPPLTPQMVANLQTVGLIATSSIPTRLQVQYPLTKDQGGAYARDCAQQVIAADSAELDQVLENSILGALASAVMIPTSVAGQTINGCRGLTAARLHSTARTIEGVVNNVHLQESLRENVAQRIQALTTQPVKLVQKALPPGNEAECAQMSCFMAGTLSWTPDGQTPAYYLRRQNVDTALEIEIGRHALLGDGVVNPAMFLCLEARATLIRVETMAPIYSLTVNYRSGARKFAQWAANDGEPLQQEIEQCIQSVSAAIVDHLAVPAWSQQKPMELAGHIP
jgi:hypothetical protein